MVVGGAHAASRVDPSRVGSEADQLMVLFCFSSLDAPAPLLRVYRRLSGFFFPSSHPVEPVGPLAPPHGRPPLRLSALRPPLYVAVKFEVTRPWVRGARECRAPAGHGARRRSPRRRGCHRRCRCHPPSIAGAGTTRTRGVDVPAAASARDAATPAWRTPPGVQARCRDAPATRHVGRRPPVGDADAHPVATVGAGGPAGATDQGAGGSCGGARPGRRAPLLPAPIFRVDAAPAGRGARVLPPAGGAAAAAAGHRGCAVGARGGRVARDACVGSVCGGGGGRRRLGDVDPTATAVGGWRGGAPRRLLGRPRRPAAPPYPRGSGGGAWAGGGLGVTPDHATGKGGGRLSGFFNWGGGEGVAPLGCVS